MNGFWILYGVCGLFLSGYLAFKVYAKLIGKVFRLSLGKSLVCVGASLLLLFLERGLHGKIMMLHAHPLFGSLGMLLFAVLFACAFAGITVKREEMRLKKRRGRIVVSPLREKPGMKKVG